MLNKYGLKKTKEIIIKNNKKYIGVFCHCGKKFYPSFYEWNKRKSCGCLRAKFKTGSKARNGIKKCCLCIEEKTTKEFSKSSKSADGFNWACRECNYFRSIKYQFGLTKDKYYSILRDQNNSCACCGTKTDSYWKRFSIDHCHSTNKIRGILCNKCNLGIGRLGDNLKKIELAIKYLENKFYENKGTFSQICCGGGKRRGTLSKDGLKVCSLCRENKSELMFDKYNKTKDGLNSNCKKCRKISRVAKLYNIDRHEIEKLILGKKVCDCCEKGLKEDFHIDHCHKSRKIRGVLCSDCNCGIGSLGDDLESLKIVYQYLQKFEEENDSARGKG